MTRIVVWGLAIGDPPWALPASTLVERPWIAGGERTLYEIAVAAASAGVEAELRGAIAARQLEELCEAAGARPQVDLPPREPSEEDLIVLPDGHVDPLPYARVSLSPARGVIAVLAPPGLFGPGLERGFAPPDPLTVDPRSVGLPRHYRAMASLGFDLWTNSTALDEAAGDAGVRSDFIGTGQPIPFPDPGPKTNDVAVIGANRWAPLARQVGERLGAPYVEIPEGDRSSIVRTLAQTRILLLPARIEGQARLQIEARAVGCVPVALRSNRFAMGLDREGGAVVVDSLDEMAGAVRALLADRAELEELAGRGVRTARAQADWPRFVGRIRELVARDIRDDPGHAARAAIGDSIQRWMAGGPWDDLRALREAFDAARRGIDWLSDRRDEAETKSRAMAEELAWLRDVADRAQRERDAAAAELARFKRRRSVRAAVRAAALASRLRRRRRPDGPSATRS